MTIVGVVALATTVLPPATAAAQASARSQAALDAALHGEHDRVITLLEAAAGRSADEHALLGEALARRGKRADALRVWSGCAAAPECARAQGRWELDEGDRRRAVAVLTPAARAHPADVRLQALLGEALYAVGQDVAARKLTDPLADLYQQGRTADLHEQVAVARSLWLNGYFKDANEVLADANEAVADQRERKAVEGTWAQLFLQKYNFRDADGAWTKVLAIDPRDEDALLGMARIDLDSDHDVPRARARLDGLLAYNPASVRGMCLRAEVALADEDDVKAAALVEAAAKIAPTHREVLALRVTLALLADDAKAAERALAEAWRIDPSDGWVLLTAARHLEAHHRYREVVTALRRALDRDPENWQAHAALGMGLARMADDDGARRHLQEAFAQDPFHVRTANVLSVLYDGVLRHMVLLTGAKVDLRVHRSERVAFERTVLPFLQTSHDDLAQRYGFAADKPLRVEIFPTTEQFSVRTLGLPRLGAHAVCFGHLITSRSPSEQPFNWKLVLHHELAHVFHIQATGGRVPRWLTEGLAMRESERLDSRYHMIFERALYDRAVDDELAPIAKFNLAFSQARSGQDIMMAYYQAFFLVRFLEERHGGFDKLRKLVAGHRDGTPTVRLLAKLYGESPERLDAAFAAWVRGELHRFDGDFRPSRAALERALRGPWAQHDDVKSREALAAWLAAVAAKDGPAAARALQGLGGDEPAAAPPTPPAPPAATAPVVAAGAAPGEAIAAAGPRCGAHFAALAMAEAGNDGKRAALHAAALVARPPCDGVRQRLVLAASLAERDPAAALTHLRRAAAIDPRDAAVLRAMLALPEQTLAGEARRDLLLQAMALEPNDAELPTALHDLAWAQLAPSLLPGARAPGQPPATPAGAAKPPPAPPAPLAPAARRPWVDALAAAARALEEVQPASVAAVVAEARAAFAHGQAKMALPVYQLALQRAPGGDVRRRLWCELGEVAYAAGAADDAKVAREACTAP